MSVNITFLGGADTVTGSKFLVQHDGHALLVDCGLFQGYKQLRLRNWARQVFDPALLDAVILTHAHIDHSGYLPRLAQQGFSGPIWCSPATLELCRVLLPDSGSLQEEDAKFANRHGFSKHHPALPLYTREQAEAVLAQFRTVAPSHRFEPLPGLGATLHEAGHILGATFVHLEGGGTSVTLSGDLGRQDDPLMRPPAAPPDSDYVVIESTYGDRRHPPVDADAELLGWLQRALARGGVTVIPGFAVGRAQALLWQIARLKSRGLLPDVPVYLDSPMASDVTALYRVFRHSHRLDEAQTRAMCTAATFINSPAESMRLDQQHGPMIIVSASGMATGGRVLHHLKAFAGDARNLVLFAGFQSPGTRGASLVAGSRRLRIHGQETAIQAEVGQLESFSSHADADELLGWLQRLPHAPRRVYVTHGEPGASDALRARIEHELHWSASVPEYRETVQLGGG